MHAQRQRKCIECEMLAAARFGHNTEVTCIEVAHHSLYCKVTDTALHACTSTDDAELCMLVQPQAMLSFACLYSHRRYCPMCLQLPKINMMDASKPSDTPVDASKPSDTPDFDCIQALQAKDFDLVLSLEVLEHMPGD